MKRFGWLAFSRILGGFCLALLVLAAPCEGSPGRIGSELDAVAKGHGNVADMVVARVNGVELTLENLMRRMDALKMAKHGRQELTEQLAERLKREALDELVTEELAFQRAKYLVKDITEEDIASHISSLEESLGGPTHFVNYLESLGVTKEEYRKEAKRVIAVERLVAIEIDEKIHVGEMELRKIFEEKKEDLVQKERVDVDDIVFFLDPEKQESFARVEEIRKMIEAQGDFSKLENNDSFHIRTGVTLGESKEPALYDAAKKLQAGEVSPPVVSDGTIHIVRLVGYIPRKEKTFEEVEAELKRNTASAIRRRMMQAWIAELHKNAKIEIVNLTAR